MSENDVEIKMADVNASYFKVKCKFIYASAQKGVQEEESIISVKYNETKLSLGSLFGITRQSLVHTAEPRDAKQ